MAKTEGIGLSRKRLDKRYKQYQTLILILFGVTIIIPVIIMGILIILGRIS